MATKLTNLFANLKSKEERFAMGERVVTLMKEGKIKPSDMSIKDIALATLGADAMFKIQDMHEDNVAIGMRESVDAVSLTAFTNITQMMVTQGAVDAFQSPEFIGDQLVTAISSREDNIREPGLAPIDDDTLVVPEGEEYPTMKFGEDYQDLPKSDKRGGKIGITREMMFFDRTGKVLELSQSIGNRLGTNKEKRILSVVLGLVNNYNRKGVARDTYLPVGTDPKRANQLSGTPLVDWSSIDTALNLFNAMVDDRLVGEPIQVTADTILHSSYKRMNVARILSATEVRKTTTDVTIGSNPLASLALKPLTSPWIDWLLTKAGISAVNAREYWHIGQPKKSFVYRTIFPFSIRQAAANDTADFERDIVAQFRCDERGVAYTKSPWYMAQLYNA